MAKEIVDINNCYPFEITNSSSMTKCLKFIYMNSSL